MTTFDPSPRLTEQQHVRADVDGDLFAASAMLHHEHGTARVHVIGDLCPTSAPVLRRMLSGLVSDGIRAITVDMTELRLCTSHGVDVLDEVGRGLAAHGGSLSVEHPHGVVRRVLEVTHPDIDVAP